MRLARATAPPDMTMLREANVPKPKAVLSVSPCRTEMRAGSMPSSSQAICDSAVSSPWPCDWMPTISTRLPSGQDARGAAFETGDDRGAARGELGGAVCGLLGEAGEADADQPPVRLAVLLARADLSGRFSNSAQSRTLAG